MKRAIPQRGDYDWFRPISVAWGDMDALGHVNNAAYLVYSESGRIAFFDALFETTDLFRAAQGPIVAEITCRYIRQLAYPAECEIAVGIQRIGNSSLVVSTPLFLRGEDDAVADMTVTIVWFDYGTQRPVPVPERLHRYLADHPIRGEQQ